MNGEKKITLDKIDTILISPHPKENWRERFDKLCVLTEDGKCKYWNPSAFGYQDTDMEAPLDKFFPEHIKSFISREISEAEKRGEEKGYVNRGIVEAEIKAQLIKEKNQLTKDNKEVRQNFIKELSEWAEEKKWKKYDEIPCPDKMPGCIVNHHIVELSPEHIAYNQALSDLQYKLKELK